MQNEIFLEVLKLRINKSQIKLISSREEQKEKLLEIIKDFIEKFEIENIHDFLTMMYNTEELRKLFDSLGLSEEDIIDGIYVDYIVSQFRSLEFDEVVNFVCADLEVRPPQRDVNYSNKALTESEKVKLSKKTPGEQLAYLVKADIITQEEAIDKSTQSPEEQLVFINDVIDLLTEEQGINMIKNITGPYEEYLAETISDDELAKLRTLFSIMQSVESILSEKYTTGFLGYEANEIFGTPDKGEVLIGTLCDFLSFVNLNDFDRKAFLDLIRETIATGLY